MNSKKETSKDFKKSLLKSPTLQHDN